MLIWLYASLRPMFGVGPRTALIASSFMFVFIFAFGLNYTNLGLFPLRLTLLDALNLIIELPLALIAGATKTPNFLAVTPQDKQAGSFPMLPRDVVAEGLAHLHSGPRHIAGRMNRAVTFVLSRLLPRRWAVRFMGSQLRKIYLG